MNDLIKISNLKKTYDGRRYVLNGLDFSIGEGEIATIWGASGCGKSTFLNIIGLLDDFTSGEYIFDGTLINPQRLNSYNLLRAREIGFVFQSYCLIDALSVKDNILMPYLYNDLRITKDVNARVDDLLARFNMEDLKQKKASLLSGGERQRVAIIRALIKHPRLIIADEPTGNLDEANALLVCKAFSEAANEGTSTIVVTHNRQLDFGSGRKFTLRDGVLY